LAPDGQRASVRTVVEVLLLDQSRILAEALKERLEREPDIRVVAAVGSVPMARRIVDSSRLDVAVCDVDLAVDLLGSLDHGAAGDGRPHVVVLAEVAGGRRATDLVQVGIAAWVTRDQPVQALIDAIRGAVHGETRIPPVLLTAVLRDLRTFRERRTQAESRLTGLTAREREILDLLTEGLDRREVAMRLHLSQHTVRTHLQNIRTSLAVHSTLAAVALARASELEPGLH
jgi:DNA-binding NarL/FixJ family response regulator